MAVRGFLVHAGGGREGGEEVAMYHLCLFYVAAIKWSPYNIDYIVNYML